MDVSWWKMDQAQADGNTESTKVPVLTIIHEASGMQVAIRVPGQTSLSIWKAFASGWLRWAGKPVILRVDPHRAHISK